MPELLRVARVLKVSQIRFKTVFEDAASIAPVKSVVARRPQFIRWSAGDRRLTRFRRNLPPMTARNPSESGMELGMQGLTRHAN
jgi:hypothetical protein